MEDNIKCDYALCAHLLLFAVCTHNLNALRGWQIFVSIFFFCLLPLEKKREIIDCAKYNMIAYFFNFMRLPAAHIEDTCTLSVRCMQSLLHPPPSSPHTLTLVAADTAPNKNETKLHFTHGILKFGLKTKAIRNVNASALASIRKQKMHSMLCSLILFTYVIQFRIAHVLHVNQWCARNKDTEHSNGKHALQDCVRRRHLTHRTTARFFFLLRRSFICFNEYVRHVLPFLHFAAIWPGLAWNKSCKISNRKEKESVQSAIFVNFFLDMQLQCVNMNGRHMTWHAQIKALATRCASPNLIKNCRHKKWKKMQLRIRKSCWDCMRWLTTPLTCFISSISVSSCR